MARKLRKHARWAFRDAKVALGHSAVLNVRNAPGQPGAVLLHIDRGSHALTIASGLEAMGYAVDLLGLSRTGRNIVLRVRPGGDL